MQRILIVIIVLISLSIISCGSTSLSPGYSGLSFTLQWPDDVAINKAEGVLRAAPSGVVTVRMSVSGSGMTTMSQSFPVAAGTGSINNVPPGTNRTITFEGLNAGNTVTYVGMVLNVNLTAGQTYNCGPVTMATVSATIPTAPIGVVAVAGNSQNTITWSIVTNATGYNIYWATTSGVNKSSTKISNVTSPYTHSPLTNGMTFYYVVTAVNGSSESIESLSVNATPFAPTDTFAPSIPTGLTATAASSTQVNLSWAASTDNVGVTGYKIYRGGIYLMLVSSGTSTADINLTSSTSYCYSVSAIDAANNESAQCTQVCATTQAFVIIKVPDTGQTTKYSTAFGDDSDYLINPPSYTDNLNGTITDNVTGLMWQKFDDGTSRSWATTGAYCTGLALGGYSTGWRLPTRQELLNIVDFGTVNPTINATYFPTTQLTAYWSSTTSAGNATNAWYVTFSDGHAHDYAKTATGYVRCVR